MQLGASISIEDLDTVRQTLTRTPMYDEAKAQMEKGLDGYKSNGEKWDFENPGLQETANKLPTSDKQSGGEYLDSASICSAQIMLTESDNGKGYIGMNVFEDWNKRPKGMPGGPNDMENPDIWKLPAKAEKKPEQKATGTDILGMKGMLKAWLDS